MSALDSLRQWTASLNDLLPNLSRPVRKAAAAFSLGMALGRHCQAARVAAAVPSAAAAPASSARRFERLLANDGLDADAATADLVRGLAAAWSPGRPWTLVVDETDRDDRVRSMQLLLAYKRRAVPVACRAYPPTFGDGGRPRLLLHLLGVVAAALPPGTPVTLLADRGLAWPSVVRFCRGAGWHFVVRVQGQTAVRPAGWPRHVRADALAPDDPAYGPVACAATAFKAAGWVECHVTAARGPDGKPWLLVGDEPGGPARCRRYADRTWCEEAFRDEKSSGFCWRQSRVDDPAHATRLLVVIGLAMLLCLATGCRVIKRGLRRRLDPHPAVPRLSYFQLGLRWLLHQCLSGAGPPLPLTPRLV